MHCFHYHLLFMDGKYCKLDAVNWMATLSSLRRLSVRHSRLLGGRYMSYHSDTAESVCVYRMPTTCFFPMFHLIFSRSMLSRFRCSCKHAKFIDYIFRCCSFRAKCMLCTMHKVPSHQKVNTHIDAQIPPKTYPSVREFDFPNHHFPTIWYWYSYEFQFVCTSTCYCQCLCWIYV